MECDDAAVERQKLVSEEEGQEDDQTITNLSSSGPAKSIQTPISPVLSSKIFSSGETSRSGHTASLGKPNEGAASAKLNYINERRNQEQKAKPKKVPQRDLTPSSAVSSGGGGGDGGSHSRYGGGSSSYRDRGPSLLRASAEHSSSLANSSVGGGGRQHSTAATANSSSISLNKSHSFTSRPLKHHSFISEVPDVRHMERALLGLLEDFHSGKLKAFGSGCTMEQMTSIREQQECLAKLHFDLGNEPSFFASNAAHNETQSQTNMQKLVAKLEQLSFSIEKLHSSNVEQ